LRSVVVSFTGERRALVNYYDSTPDNLKSFLYFFLKLKEGNTEHEKKKYIQMLERYKAMITRLERAISLVDDGGPLKGLPILLELQSSTLDSKISPIMFPIAQMVTEEMEQSYGAKIYGTPDGGRLVKLDLGFAKILTTVMKEIGDALEAKTRSFDQVKDFSSPEFNEKMQELTRVYARRSGITSPVERSQTQAVINAYLRAKNPSNVTIASNSPYSSSGPEATVTCEALFMP
jgi:hypothetical protein